MLNSKNNYLGFEAIGEFISEEDWCHPIRSIKSYELIFVLSGTVYIFEDDEKYELKADECILLEPWKTHGGYKESSGFTSFYWFHFLTDFDMPFKTLTDGDFYDIKYMLKKLLHMSNTPSYDLCALDAASLLIYKELVHASSAESGNSLVHKVAEYIRINIGKNITVTSIADYFGYSPDYLSKLFMHTFGLSAKEYITSERMKFAKNMLLTTNLSVKEISARMDFPEENNFINFFKYHEKISPSRFRNKYFNVHMNNK